jgi:uncharacterized protein (UPF0262 family)
MAKQRVKQGGAIMAKTDLKTFDIETYDIELDFNKKIAPIQSKIDKLDSTYEQKSLKAHNDFIKKEKASTKKLTDLDKKSVAKVARIQKATENKLLKTSKKEQSIKSKFDAFKQDQQTVFDKKKSLIKEVTDSLSNQKEQDIAVVKKKYKDNVESYVEKLTTYNNNFENNKQIFLDQYHEYSKMLDEYIVSINASKKSFTDEIDTNLDNHRFNKQEENLTIDTAHSDFRRASEQEVLEIRKNINKKVQDERQYIAGLKHDIEESYTTLIKALEADTSTLTNDHEKRLKAMETDFQLSCKEISEQVHEKKKQRKEQSHILDLFEKKYNAMLAYETTLYQLKISMMNKELVFLKESLKQELANFDRLFVFILNDYEQLKNTSEYFKDNNISLSLELSKTEQLDNDYFMSYESLKHDFLQEHLSIFDTLKRRLISSNKSQIEQLSTINSELDDINKFLDTVEPLKEIELNKLRESIEISEIDERYNIKYAKQDHEMKLLENELKKIIELEEVTKKIDLKNNDTQITEIKAKQILDIALEEAKLKYAKADEVRKLRLNSVKLERNILKASYDNELEKVELLKDKASLVAKKKNAVAIKTMEKQIENISIETKYKSEVLQKRLEEDLLKLQDKILKLESDRDAFENSIDSMIAQQQADSDKEIDAINKNMDYKLSQIQEALEREIKTPLLNIARYEAVINEKLHKFTTTNDNLEQFIKQVKETIQDTSLSAKQQQDLFLKNANIAKKSKQYLDTIYEYYQESILFMLDHKERALLQEIAASAEENKIKKLQKQITKLKQDSDKELQVLQVSKKEQWNRIQSMFKGNTSKFAKLKNLDQEAVSNQVNQLLDMHHKQLNTLQERVYKDVQKRYKELTSSDQKVVDFAKQNAIKASNEVEKERQVAIEPLHAQFAAFIQEKNTEKAKVLEDYNANISNIKEEIATKEQDCQNEVNKVNDEQYTLLKEKQAQLQELKASDDAKVAQAISQVTQSLDGLDEKYKQEEQQLITKEQEAEKIYEYEGRIYQIACETAESRYNETIEKANKANDLMKQDFTSSITTIKEIAKRNIERINKELIDKTNEFEKNIYTVRPRFEESIGDAQKAIDEKQTNMLQRKQELEEMNQVMTSTLTNGLHQTFNDAYEQLEQNLQFYVDKHSLIKDQYSSALEDSNQAVEAIQDSLQQTLITLGEKKVEQTIKQLQDVNNKSS